MRSAKQEDKWGKARPRYRCKTCGKMFSAQVGTMFAGLRKPKALIVIVVTLLAYGCPVQAIVQGIIANSSSNGLI